MVLVHGARIGFFQGDIRSLSDDLCALKPTVFPVVPRLLNRMYDRVGQPSAPGRHQDEPGSRARTVLSALPTGRSRGDIDALDCLRVCGCNLGQAFKGSIFVCVLIKGEAPLAVTALPKWENVLRFSYFRYTSQGRAARWLCGEVENKKKRGNPTFALKLWRVRLFKTSITPTSLFYI